MIEINNIKKSYDKSKTVLKGISLKVERGEIFGLLGANGAGKTTLIKIMTGLLNEDSGKVMLDGKGMDKDIVATKKSFYFMPDNYKVYNSITGREWIRFVCSFYDLKEGEYAGKVDIIANKFNMDEALDVLIGKYSFGMMNKLGIMLGFIINPPILIYDEPLNGLDPYAIVAYKELLKDYVDKGGTVFYSTHLLDLAQTICTKVAILREGIILKILGLEQIKNMKSLEEMFMEVTGYEKHN
ncbi:ABC transporter ATP-binding protein [[Clostridium] polysaccharolyticum]|uniref:ABC-2 type transport system ATP-binding protein n=1 Tax=[Clostridium] polysaccharolyticum TaxID=29364 RepID=A0A1I0DQM3_9FIRM|nr:ABC transporter ATP-binding protein [[Clostridium] polysaccharolyticum]SET34473.1 ABC-2 type transport system ATP-binding protein [[Clostridium] polysaccharolyticum]